MGAFYGTKIEAKEINANTGKAWVIDDVPKFWRKKVEAWLADKAK